jgi:hypothetical protein
MTWVLASVISGALASAMSLPFDNVKTKMQKQIRLPDGTLPYKSFIDCAMKTAKNESIAGFWAGLPTYIVRIAPHVMIVSTIGKVNMDVDTRSIRVPEENDEMKTSMITLHIKLCLLKLLITLRYNCIF